ncbi:MAG: hypothetical protein JNK11_10090 [Alphaproteobacteria bacterium]|nr:hypothetical protein [Alphaproteobacteria bacterium]
MGTYDVVYSFRHGERGEQSQVFTVTIDADTVIRKPSAKEAAPPQWTALGFQQCPNCPLKAETHPTCPVAQSLVSVVDFGNQFKSYNKVGIAVTTEERSIAAETTAQVAFGSLIGLLTATSGCPHTAFLKPMARFHLPFASLEETIYRVFAMYLLAQYFRAQAGEKADFDLGGLKRMYENIETVNLWMTRRLHAASQTDASLNAVIVLDTFAKTMLAVIDEKVDELKHLFAAYLPKS